jgi:lysophospholipase
MAGRGDAYEKYLESYEHWRSRGWRVSAADWRGQAGSGRLGLDEVTGHVDDFALWIDDLGAFWRDWTMENAGPHVLVGHSMGGHLALRAVAEGALEPAPAALVLSAPMCDVLPEALPLLVKERVAQIMAALGDPRRPAWKWSERPGEVPLSRQSLLTHDDARYADELWWREKRPELVMGPGSWGWVLGAMRSIRALSRPGALERVRMPVFLFATSVDRLVGCRAIRRAVARLPNAQALWFGAEARHEILREVDPVRDRALAAMDRFLDEAVPA